MMAMIIKSSAVFLFISISLIISENSQE